MSNSTDRQGKKGKSEPELPPKVGSRLAAQTMLRPSVNAASTIRGLYPQFKEDIELGDLIDEMLDQCRFAASGDLTRAESMLTAQAHTLDALFNQLISRSTANMGQYMQACETYMRLALKAQSQCRTTLETLAAIKNPPMIFAKQANVTTGPQQVNNGNYPTVTRAGARENDKVPPNKLLEETHGERLDTGTASGAVNSNQELEAVGAFKRTEDD